MHGSERHVVVLVGVALEPTFSYRTKYSVYLIIASPCSEILGRKVMKESGEGEFVHC